MNLGKWQVRYSRLLIYISVAMHGLNTTLLLRQSQVPLKYILLLACVGLVAVVIITLLDVMVVFPQAQKYITQKNPIVSEMAKKIDELHRRLAE